MKFNTKIGMIPLAISLSSNAMQVDATQLKFSEDDIKKSLIDIDKHALNYFKTNTAEVSKIYLKQRFVNYYKNWDIKTRYYSFADEIVSDVDFLNIVKMGNQAIPFILEEIKDKPSQLVWALNLITGSKISRSSSLTISEACRLWVKWGKSQKLI